MASIREIIREIKERSIGAAGRSVLLVEGVSDELAFRSFLTKKDSQWEAKWVIASAGSKSNVLKILEREPSWYGVVDADEWGANGVPSAEGRLRNLFVLPRFCIENYLILPDELWLAIPEHHQKRASLETLKKEVEADLALWVSHGVLWSIVHPLWSGIRDLGFKEKLLEPSVALDEASIKKTLKGWHDFLDPDNIWTKYQARLADVKKRSQEEQLKRWVHGKKYFDQNLTKNLNQWFGQQKSEVWKKELFKNLPLPSDLDGLWKMMNISDEGGA